MSENVLIRRHAPPKLNVSKDAAIPMDGTSYMNDTSQVTDPLRQQLHVSNGVCR
jgi:hypothetical protein